MLQGSKVRDLQLSSVHIHKYIISFDVSVHDALVMEVLDPLHDLPGVVADGWFILQRTPLVLQEE